MCIRDRPNTVVLVSLKPLENDLRFKEHLRRRRSSVSVPPAVDLRWDFIHGFIDFGEARDPQVQEAAIRNYRNRHPNVKYGGFVNSAEELVSSTDTPHLTVDDAVRSEYDQLARDHVLGLPDQQQKLLNIALGGGGEATLIQFASSCAARIMFEDLSLIHI